MYTHSVFPLDLLLGYHGQRIEAVPHEIVKRQVLGRRGR